MIFEWDETKNRTNIKMTISKKRIKQIQEIKDEDIDFSDIQELDIEFFKKAEIKLPENKKTISIRLDNDVMEWFKTNYQRGYQTRINSLLKAYVIAQSEISASKAVTKMKVKKNLRKKV